MSAGPQRLTSVGAGEVDVGDVLLTRTGKWWSFLIRLGASLRDQPNVWNHVIIAHHRDDAGTWWGIEGRAGGVGWVDLRTVIADRWTFSNREQPRTPEQRALIAEAAFAAIATPYDWGAIVVDAMQAISPLWRLKHSDWAEGTVPGHVVCSALADWAHERAGVPSPASDRWCTPADWATFIINRGWQ